MQLSQNISQLVGDGQTDVGAVLQHRYTFIGQVEEDYCRPQNMAFAQDIHIQDLYLKFNARLGAAI